MIVLTNDPNRSFSTFTTVPEEHTVLGIRNIKGVFSGKKLTVCSMSDIGDDISQVNFTPMKMDIALQRKAREADTPTSFVTVSAPCAVQRRSILFSHEETEPGYKVDRIVHNFVAHAFVTEGNLVEIYGSEYPDMYPTTGPLIRIFSTHEETGTIKEVDYFDDNPDPKTIYFGKNDSRYEKLATYRKSTFIMCHDGERFTNKVRIPVFGKVLISEDYAKTMISKKPRLRELKDVADYHYCGGVADNQHVVPIFTAPTDIDAVKALIDQENVLDTGKFAKWFLIGFPYEVARAAREYVQNKSNSNRPRPNNQRPRNPRRDETKNADRRPEVRNMTTQPTPESSRFSGYSHRNDDSDSKKKDCEKDDSVEVYGSLAGLEKPSRRKKQSRQDRTGRDRRYDFYDEY